MTIVWTEEHVRSFISRLKSDPRGLWDAYIEEEKSEGGGLGDEIRQWILNSLYQSYPQYSLKERLGLLIRFRATVRSELGLPFAWDSQGKTL